MVSAIRFCTISIVLNVFIHTTAFSLQQTPELFVKGLSNSSTLLPITEADTVYTIRDTSFMQIDTKLKLAAARLKEKVARLDQYIKTNDFNPDYCFLVDMAIPSGKKRFFVYNLKLKSVEYSALVSHGSGSYFPGCNDQLVFSNMPNSNATSLGKYKIGSAYQGKYGLSYKLFGLDSTNNNAFQRSIVLHSDAYVPQTETYPRHIYESAGCPAVSPVFLKEIGKYIRTSDKPILLWIYN